MRGSRRRLSVGAVGGNPGNSNSLRANGSFLARYTLGRGGGAISKDFTEQHALPSSLERRASARSIGSDGTLPCYDMGGGALKPPRSFLSSSLPSSASPEAMFGHIRMFSPPSPPPSLQTVLRSQGAESSRAMALSADSCTGLIDEEPTAAHFAAIAAPSAELLPSTPLTSPSSVGSHGNSASEQPPSMLYGYDVASADECSDDEVRNEPLPTPEQLIFSQSWSTWPTPCHHLYSGSKFSGTQSNGTRSYDVSVTLKYVDMGVPELCGHFTIRGLTSELPKLTTYFDAQIVGTSSNSFITNQWDASVDTDRTHWSFFPAFRHHRNRFDCKDFKYRLSLSDKYIFMRWKERFVVPNYKLNRISGASYDGFYYVCYDREEATITGYYYHRDSDHYQCLKLTHTKQTSFSHFELA
ncbi:hypothetical protein GGI04_001980 [Coemansia thaxteri]|nr:hypothetical protein GGI04_001980 [Coemansia thaxteri]